MPEPVGAIIIHRHGRTKTWLDFPRDQQGLYPLTAEELQRAKKVGRKIMRFFLRQPDVLPALRKRGLRLRGAPSPLVRAIQTQKRGSEGMIADAQKKNLKVRLAWRHGKPVSSLTFIKGYPYLHYPPRGSDEERWCEELEDKLIAGGSHLGMEPLEEIRHRTRTPAVVRKRMVSGFTRGSSQPFSVYHYASHGTAKAPEDLSAPVGPTGLALRHLFSEAERRRFGIPVELVRGEAVAAVVYSDGSIRAAHIKP